MPPLQPFEQMDAGGVDSRSNPLNMPKNRALRCLNWVPKNAGFWELRWGYSSVSMSALTAGVPVSGIFPYRTWSGHKYVLYMQGTTWSVLDTATGTVTIPPVLPASGSGIQPAGKGNGFFANNRFHYGDGANQRWLDGANWRVSGLPALTADQVQAITITEGVRELTPVEASTITLSAASGGSFLDDTQTGHLIYVAFFDTSTNEIGPATISVAAGRILVAAGEKITVANMPTPTNPNWVKLIGGTADGGSLAYLFIKSTSNISSVTPSSTNTIVSWSASSVRGIGLWIVTVMVQTALPHLLSPGSSVMVTMPSGAAAASGIYNVNAVADATHFTYQYATGLPVNGSGAGGSIAGREATVVSPGHGLTTGDIASIQGTAGYDGRYQVSVIDGNTFVFASAPGPSPTLGAGGTVTALVTADNATSSVDVLAPTADSTYQLNQNLGLAASTIGSVDAGYQFVASIYNPNGGGHVGNYALIGAGGRALETAYRSNWHISALPDLSSLDPEWVLLIGRTGDGAEVPYPCTDNVGNFAIAQGQTSLTITQANIATQPMPTRNGIIPAECASFCVAGDFCYASDPNSAYLRRSGDLSQAVERGDSVLGRPEQSWAADDIDTFPTGEALTGIFEVDQEVFCGTLNDCALSVNLAGVEQWNGPWGIGLAGSRAAAKCGAIGFFWLTGDKQLAMFSQGVPVIVSDEYELAELSQIGDQYLPAVELVYFRSAALGKEELRIEGQKADGTPYTVIHDFKLRELDSAPGALYGQGYSSTFLGPLASAFTSAQVRDGNGKLQVFCGDSNGRLYQLYSGADDVGNQYAGDLILLVNGGTGRPDVSFLDFYGDSNIKITVGRNLSSSLAPGAQWGFTPPNPDADFPTVVPGAEQDFLYRFYLVPPEVQQLYVRFQLASHSADGNLALNNPPHLPLESYGRLYEMIPAMGDERDR